MSNVRVHPVILFVVYLSHHNKTVVRGANHEERIMKKLLAAATIAIALAAPVVGAPSAHGAAAPTPPPTPPRTERPCHAEYYDVTYVRVNRTSSKINVRSGPGTQYRVLTTASSGEGGIWVATSSDGNWYKVRYTRGTQTGWISAAYTKKYTKTYWYCL